MGTTYILVRKDTPAERKAALKDYFAWCFTEGAASAKQLHYTPLSAEESAQALKVLGE